MQQARKRLHHATSHRPPPVLGAADQRVLDELVEDDDQL